MFGFKSALWAVLTCLVAFATVCALVLPEEDGARDNFVRLTRSGSQRQCLTGSSCHETEDSDSRLESPERTSLTVTRSQSGNAAAILPRLARTTPPVGDGARAPLLSAEPPEHHRVSVLSDRAPPSL